LVRYRKNSEASEEDVALVNIPEKLKPNLSEIPYVFNFKEHKMYFLSGGTDTGVGHHAISSLFDLIKIILQLLKILVKLTILLFLTKKH